MSFIAFTLLQRWTALNTSKLSASGLIVLLSESQDNFGAPQLVLELESRMYLGRLALTQDGNVQLGCADKRTEAVRRGEGSIFTEGQLESAIEQLLEWMGEGNGDPFTRQVMFKCPEGKATYISRSEARMMKKRVGMPGSVTEYRCQHCGHWHLGNKKGRSSVRRRSFRK